MSEEKLRAEIEDIRERLGTIGKRLDEISAFAYREISTKSKIDSELNPEKLEQLPWRPFKPGDRAGWIFADDAPQELIELLKESRRRVPIGNYAYKLSEGYDRLFVNRVPITEMTSKRQQGSKDRAIQTLITNSNDPRQDSVAKTEVGKRSE